MKSELVEEAREDTEWVELRDWRSPASESTGPVGALEQASWKSRGENQTFETS